MNWFYSKNIEGNLVIIEGEEAQHASKVLRLKVGAKVAVIDGIGGYYECEVLSTDKRKLTAHVLNKREHFKSSAYRIHIAIAPTKNMSRFEWFLEKSTEMGINEISPILSKNSERKHIRPDRLQKILISATKQSQKAKIPTLNPLVDLNTFLTSVNTKEKYIAYCNYENKHLIRQLNPGKDVLVLIGPEGDFNSNEIETVLEHGFKPIGLGKERLRTETAGIMAIAAIHLFHENMS